MKQHALSAAFPAMTKAARAELREDLKENGQQIMIIVFEGMILDGWHRYQILTELGIEPKTKELQKGKDPVAFVRSVNMRRRNMNASQRAMAEVAISEWTPHGGHNKQVELSSTCSPSTTAEMAQAADVSTKTIQQAKTVTEESPPATVKAVIEGKRSVRSAAAEVAKIKRQKPSKDGKPEPIRDSTGYAIPEKMLPLWNRRSEVKDVLDSISHARSVLRKVMEKMKDEDTDQLYAPANVSGACAKLNDAWTTISMAMPYAVCPICQGRTPDSCKSCKGRGFVPRHTFEHAFPAELLAIREKACVK